jgi:cell division protein FtsL
MMYVQGNLAIKEKRVQAAKEEVRRVVRRRKPIPVMEKLFYLLAVLICVTAAGLVILRYAQIYEVNAKIQQLEKEIQRLENENNTLQLEVNVLNDPKRLFEKAKMLGLRPAEEGEISEIPSRSDTAGRDVAFSR